MIDAVDTEEMTGIATNHIESLKVVAA